MNIKGWISDYSSQDDYRLTAVIEKHLLEWLGRRVGSVPSDKITLPGYKSSLKVMINGHIIKGRSFSSLHNIAFMTNIITSIITTAQKLQNF